MRNRFDENPGCNPIGWILAVSIFDYLKQMHARTGRQRSHLLRRGKISDFAEVLLMATGRNTVPFPEMAINFS